MPDTVLIEVPLAPQVLRLAGVPLEDALWLNRLPAGKARFTALRTSRGESILASVRNFIHRVTAREAMLLTTV